MATVIVSPANLQSALNAAAAGDTIRVTAGTVTYQAAIFSTKAVTIRGDDPANPPVFAGGGQAGFYGLYVEGGCTIGPDLVFRNPTGYGLGVRANNADITGGLVTGCTFDRNAISGLYQGTQPGRTHTGFIVQNCTFTANGQNVSLDPHINNQPNGAGDGEHSCYIGGGEGITVGAIVRDCTSSDQLHGTAFQGGGGLRNSTYLRCSASRIRKYGTHPASSYAGFGIFSSFQGTSGITFDSCSVYDCDGYGYKAIGGATGTVQNSTATLCALGFSFGLTDGGGNGSGVSAPVNTAVPTISGTVDVGNTITSSTGTWSNTPTSYSYAWQYDVLGNGVYQNAGVTTSTYNVTSADSGRHLRCVVTATNAAGSASATSSATAIVPTPSPAPSANSAPAVTVNGASVTHAEVGDTLAVTSSWANNPTSITYQWKRLSSGGTVTSIGGATSTSYVVTSADLDYQIACTVTASNVGGSTSASSAYTDTIVKGVGSGGVAQPVNTVAPVITGTARAGNTLSCSTGTWTSTAPITSYLYAWHRDQDGDSNYIPIASATNSTYLLTSDDVGCHLRCRVIAVNT